jgi:predicted dithiol-disulfide oxidoreductase (DUF899 family)
MGAISISTITRRSRPKKLPRARASVWQIGASDEVGISVFAKNERGEVYHTYSCYARGTEMLNGAYHYLDLVPKGRDEHGFDFPMEWVRRHDQYQRT